MTEIFNIASYYIEGKPVYPAIRRLLNLLFIVCISGFFYEKTIGEYTWLDIDDYKSILDFFIRGYFFIPFSIFLIVTFITDFTGFVIFNILNHLKSTQIQRSIINYEYNKAYIDNKVEQATSFTKLIVPIDITPEKMRVALNKLKDEITPDLNEKIKIELNEKKRDLESTFHLLLRIFLAVLLFKIGFILKIITSVVILLIMLIFVVSYWLLDITPTLIRKFKTHTELYLSEFLTESDKEKAK